MYFTWRMGVTACVSTISTTVFIASVALAHTLSPKLKKHAWFNPAHKVHHIHSWSWIKFYVFDFLSLNTTCMFHVELIYDISMFMLMCTWHWLSWVALHTRVWYVLFTQVCMVCMQWCHIQTQHETKYYNCHFVWLYQNILCNHVICSSYIQVIFICW